jgi:hypothetical protein
MLPTARAAEKTTPMTVSVAIRVRYCTAHTSTVPMNNAAGRQALGIKHVAGVHACRPARTATRATGHSRRCNGPNA